jgi:eukaryotic-like serine/threonine-protein kinase
VEAGHLPDGEAGAEARLVAGRYRLLSELGRGGMGVVWRAADELVGRPVAVKELRPPQGLSRADRETYGLRALAEARSVARIDHPGAARLYDVLPATAADDAVYLIMELVEGPTLAQLIERSGPLPGPQVAGLGLQLVSVLAAAHGLGIVHRDIKPANIIITAGGQAKLTDFGIAHTVGEARLTRSGIMGTQAYLAPELFDAAPITAAADLWSLGATLYAAAAGRGPFERASTGATLRAILIDDVPAAGCEPVLAAAISALLQRDPARRATLDQARAQLQHAAAGPATPPAAPAAAEPADAPSAPGTTEPGDSPPPVPVPLEPAAADTGTVKVARRDPALSTPAPHAATTAPPSAPPPAQAAPQPAGQPEPVPVTPQPAPADTGTAKVARRDPALSAPAPPAATTTRPPGPPRPAPDPALPTEPGTGRGRLLFAAAMAAVVAVVTAVAVPVLVLSGSDTPSGRHHVPRAPAPHPTLAATPHPTLATTLTDPAGDTGVDSLAFSPDGQLLAAADSADDTTYLWDVATRRLTASLTDPAGDNGVYSLAFSPDGQTLAEGDDSGATYLWDVATRRVTATLADPNPSYPEVESIAFSPDGKTLAEGDYGGNTYLWDVATRRITATLTGRGSGQVGCVEFSPDGKTLAVVDDRGHTYLWDVATGHLVTALKAGPEGSVDAGVSIALSPDGKLLAGGVQLDNKTKLWDIATGQLTATLSDPTGQYGDVLSVAFSPDGKLLAVNDLDSTYLWDVATRHLVATMTDPAASSVWSLAFSPDGKLLAVGSSTATNNAQNGKDQIQVWQIG